MLVSVDYDSFSAFFLTAKASNHLPKLVLLIATTTFSILL